VIRGTGEHARELGLAEPLGEGLRLLLDVAEQPLVVLRRGELEELLGVPDFLRQRPRQLDLLDLLCALPEQRLSLVLVVPEPALAGDLI
jgi:hypothetical protein